MSYGDIIKRPDDHKNNTNHKGKPKQQIFQIDNRKKPLLSLGISKATRAQKRKQIALCLNDEHGPIVKDIL